MSSPLSVMKCRACALRVVVLSLVLASAIVSLQASVAGAYEPWWVQVNAETQFWSGPDDKAIAFGPVATGTSLLVIAPQDGQRLFVQDVRTGSIAYIDASAVEPGSPARVALTAVAAPSGPSGLKRTPPKTAAGFSPFWVANYEQTELWAGPEKWAYSLGAVPQFRRFLVVEPQRGDRLRVWSPETDSIGFMDAAGLGPVGPSAWLEAHPLKMTRKVNLSGRAKGSSAYVRNLPLVADETELRHLPNNASIQIREAGVTPDGTEWYTVGDGMYVRASEVRLPTPPPAYLEGRWIDADISEPAIVTAYDGDQIVYTAMAIIGTEATPTLRGTYRILRRVDNEIMDSSTLGIPRDDRDGYYLKDVLYTQYFTAQGAALHYNYWIGTFGLPGSHGCLGLNLEDAKWYWDWASIGTPVVVR